MKRPTPPIDITKHGDHDQSSHGRPKSPGVQGMFSGENAPNARKGKKKRGPGPSSGPITVTEMVEVLTGVRLPTRRARVKVSKAQADYYRSRVSKHFGPGDLRTGEPHDQRDHGPAGSAMRGVPVVPDGADPNEEVTHADVHLFGKDLERLSSKELVAKYGSTERVRSLLHELQRSSLIPRGDLNQPDPNRVANVDTLLNKMLERMAKHRPGGKDHEQSDHGKKGPLKVDLGGRPRPPKMTDTGITQDRLPGIEDSGASMDRAEEPQSLESVPGTDDDATMAVSPEGVDSLKRLTDGLSDPKEAQEALLNALDKSPEYGPEYTAHVRKVMATLDETYNSGRDAVKANGGPLGEGMFATEHLHDHIEGVEGAYTPEREAEQFALVDTFYNAAVERGVPAEQRALILGGLPGSGKSFTLQSEAGQQAMGIADLESEFLVINPDEVKAAMIDAGMAPDYSSLGISQNEAAYLLHEESSHIAWMLAEKAQSEGRNIAWDITLSSHASGIERIDQLQDQTGPVYDISLMYVNTPPEASILGAMKRHRDGMDKVNGGRFVPPWLIFKAAQEGISDPGKGFASENKDALNKLKGVANRFYEFDNFQFDANGQRAPAVLLDSGERQPSFFDTGEMTSNTKDDNRTEAKRRRKKDLALSRVGKEFRKAAQDLGRQPAPQVEQPSEPSATAPQRPTNPLGGDPQRRPKGTPGARGTDITRLIEGYKGGEYTLQGLGETLSRHSFDKPTGWDEVQSAQDVGSAALAQEAMNPLSDGAWGEVKRHVLHGTLSQQEYLTLLRTVQEAKSGKAVEGAQPFPEPQEPGPAAQDLTVEEEPEDDATAAG